MRYDQVAVDLALTEVDKVKPKDLRKVLRLVHTLQAARLLKLRDLWPAELEAVARYIEASMPRRKWWQR